jgi:hypothetical protein
VRAMEREQRGAKVLSLPPPQPSMSINSDENPDLG